jgi:hypothetical protein
MRKSLMKVFLRSALAAAALSDDASAGEAERATLAGWRKGRNKSAQRAEQSESRAHRSFSANSASAIASCAPSQSSLDTNRLSLSLSLHFSAARRHLLWGEFALAVYAKRPRRALLCIKRPCDPRLHHARDQFGVKKSLGVVGALARLLNSLYIIWTRASTKIQFACLILKLFTLAAQNLIFHVQFAFN